MKNHFLGIDNEEPHVTRCCAPLANHHNITIISCAVQSPSRPGTLFFSPKSNSGISPPRLPPIRGRADCTVRRGGRRPHHEGPRPTVRDAAAGDGGALPRPAAGVPGTGLGAAPSGVPDPSRCWGFGKWLGGSQKPQKVPQSGGARSALRSSFLLSFSYCPLNIFSNCTTASNRTSILDTPPSLCIPMAFLTLSSSSLYYPLLN